jgi:hypothetical protein
VADFPWIVQEVLFGINKGGPQVIVDRFPDLDGFKKLGNIKKGVLEDKGYLLLSSYDRKKGQSTVQLLRISDQQVLYEWVPDFEVLRRTTNSYEIVIDPPLKLEAGIIELRSPTSKALSIKKQQ